MSSWFLIPDNDDDDDDDDDDDADDHDDDDDDAGELGGSDHHSCREQRWVRGGQANLEKQKWALWLLNIWRYFIVEYLNMMMAGTDLIPGLACFLGCLFYELEMGIGLGVFIQVLGIAVSVLGIDIWGIGIDIVDLAPSYRCQGF